MFKLLDIKKDGSEMKMWISAGMDINNDFLWSPQYLYKKVCDHVGYPKPMSLLGGKLLVDCTGVAWDINVDYQADVINYLIEEEQYEVVFSQVHNIDAASHLGLQLCKERPHAPMPAKEYQDFMEYIYTKQTDGYIDRFLHLLDEGWDLVILSDHAAVITEYPTPFSQGNLEKLGYTILKTDTAGNRLPEVDWSKTKAWINGNHNIYINAKDRFEHGIVEREDMDEVQAQLMADLSAMRHPETGHRIYSVVLRNKDAILLGYGGERCGDICVWVDEGNTMDHGDSLPTTTGYWNTYVGPTVMFAGPSFKENFKTQRIIRQVDIVPTVATALNVRMPEQCEGAPVYQILKKY